MRNDLIICNLIADGELQKNARVKSLFDSKYGDMLLSAYEALNKSILYKSYLHGDSHIQRTMLNGAMIAHAESFSERETRLLLLACSYHDIGRTYDGRDKEHSSRSAEMIGGLQLCNSVFKDIGDEDLRIIRAAVAAHNHRTSRIPEFVAEYGLIGKAASVGKRVATGLKDADGIDRIRLHDTDVSRLRFPDSPEIYKDAVWIYRIYRAKEKAL